MNEMETSGVNSDHYRNSSGGNNPRRYGFRLLASNLVRSPLSTILEYSGILRTRPGILENEGLIDGSGLRNHVQGSRLVDSATVAGGEVEIRIIGVGEQDHVRRDGDSDGSGVSTPQIAGVEPFAGARHGGRGGGEGPSSSAQSISPPTSPGGSSSAEAGNGGGSNNRDSSYQRYDIQQAAKWMEQILPFSLLLLVVFIRQHLQGICLF